MAQGWQASVWRARPILCGARAARIGWPVAAGLVLLLQTVLILRHEPFVDEWQALQIAVGAPNLASLLENLRYEGHPPLWYLLLRAVSAVTGPHQALVAAALPLALATQALILFRSPFPRWLRLMIALSEPILFEYGTISRSYTLGVMLIFWAMAAWNSRRWFWLPILLLPAVESFFGVISLALLIVRAREHGIWWPGAAAWAACSLVSAWSVLPAADFVPVYNPAGGPLQALKLLMFQLSMVSVPLQWGPEGPLWNALLPYGLFRLLWIPFLLLCWDQTRGWPLERMAVFGFVAMFWLFYVFLYTLANRHLMLIGVLLVALQWQHSRAGEPLSRWFVAWIGVGSLCGLVAAATALTIPFDTAGRAAAIIRDRGLTDKRWVSAPAQHAQGISAMTGILFQGVGQKCTSDFIRWNFPRTVDDVLQLADWSEDQVRRHGRFYLVSEVPLPRGTSARLIGSVPPGFYGKPYYLYEVGPGRPEDTRMLERCVPGMRSFPPASG